MVRANVNVRIAVTRYFAIWRRNLRENWQERFYKIQKANCRKRGRVRPQGKRREWRDTYSRSWWKERNRVKWMNVMRSTYIRVKSPNTDVADMASVRHVRHPSHVYTWITERWLKASWAECNSYLMTVLQFAPFSSLVQPAFWHELTSLKIDVLQLSDDSVPINASYALGKSIKDRETGKDIALGCNLTVGGGSFSNDSFQYAVHSFVSWTRW
jgi:hypothetical protein